jgi:hypothetical protein
VSASIDGRINTSLIREISMIRTSMTAAAVCLTALTTGCASIVSGQNQSVSVVTRNDLADVSGAQCELKNDKGIWYTTTPGSVTVRRSYNDLTVLCKHDSSTPGVASVKSSTKGMAFGNILFGGFIGAGVDMSTGAAYDYPDIVNVRLGKTITIAPPAAAASAAGTPMPASSSALVAGQDQTVSTKK